VTDNERSREGAQRRLRKNVTHQPVIFHDGDLFVLEGSHTGRLLTPVLQGVEGVVTEMGYGAARGDNANNAAGFFHDLSRLRVTRGECTGPVSHKARAP
jgi:hypothetical protein